MESRRHQTETAASATPTKFDPSTAKVFADGKELVPASVVEFDSEAPAPAKPKRERGTTTDGVKAGQIWERLKELDEEEQAEIAESPASIRARFESKRAKVLAEASDDVRKLVEKLRA